MIILSFNYDDLIIIKGPGRGEEVRQWLQEHKEVFISLFRYHCDDDDGDLGHEDREGDQVCDTG